MKLCELCEKLDTLIPKTLSEEWDNDGNMLIVDKNAEVLKILVTLDVTPDVFEKAKEINASLVISHHPFIFKPLSNLDTSSKTHLIFDFIKAGISVISYHTRFDSVKGGMNDALANALGLLNVREFETMGRIGEIESELSPEEFATYVSEKLSENVILYKGKTPVSTVALLGGGGKDFVRPARLEGAHAMVTGDVSHSVVMEECENGITIIDAGHFGTEKIFTSAIVPFLEKAGICAENIVKFEPQSPAVFVLKEF